MTAPADTIADRYVLLRLSGKTDTEAAREAGYTCGAPGYARQRYHDAQETLRRTPVDAEEALAWATRSRERAEEELARARRLESLLRLLVRFIPDGECV